MNNMVPSVPDCQWSFNKRELNIGLKPKLEGALKKNKIVFNTIAPKTRGTINSVMKYRRDLTHCRSCLKLHGFNKACTDESH